MSYVFDPKDRVTPITGPEGEIDYEYDGQTSQLRRTLSVGGTLVDTRYGYDDLGRLTRVDDGAHAGVGYTYGYDDAGMRESVQSRSPGGSGLAGYQYDAVGRLKQLNQSIGGVSTSYAYTVRADGKRTGIAETRSGGPSAGALNVLFQYDALGRLVQESSGSSGSVGRGRDYLLDYAYDLSGNRVKQVKTVEGTQTETAYAYVSDGSDLLHTETGGSTITYTHDRNGFLRIKDVGGNGTGSAAYTPDVEGRLARVVWGGRTTDFAYDESGNRVRATSAGNTRRFLNDPLNPTGYSQVLQEQNAQGQAAASYTIGQEVLRQTGGAGGAYTLWHDGHGSVRSLTDASNATSARYDYNAYGEPAGFDPLATPPLTTLLYSGEQYEASLDQYYLRARSYDPHTARFTSLDSFEGVNSDPQSLHKYAYCQGDPVDGTDPSGEYTTAEVISVVAIILFATNIANAPTYGSAVYKDRGGDLVIDMLGTVFLFGVLGGARYAVHLYRARAATTTTTRATLETFVGPPAKQNNAIAKFLRGLGRQVTPNALEGVSGAGRQGDAVVDGIVTEFKTLFPGANSSTVRNVVRSALDRGGQARRFVLDARGSGLTYEEASRGIGRIFNAPRPAGAKEADIIEIIGDDFFLSPFEAAH